MLSFRRRLLRFHRHPTDRVYLLAHIRPPRFGLMDRRLVGRHIAVAISHEPIPAAVGTKENGLIAPSNGSWRELPLDLHATHRVDRISSAAPEANSISIEPVKRGKDTQENQVEICRVVP